MPRVTVDATQATARARGFVVVAAVLGVFLFAAAAPTPLYATYAATWHFSAVALTAVFAVYALALLVTLLLAGSLSDAVGRRPVILAAIVLELVAMGLFVAADGLGWLYAARVVQGVATGLATAAVSASLIDLQPTTRPGVGALVNAVTPTFGLAAGALGAGALVQYAPGPTRLVYVLVLVACLVLAGALVAMPEPVRARHRPALRVRLGVERNLVPAFLAAVPCLVATWALGGFYLSLGPTLTLSLLGSTNRLAGASAVTLLCVMGGLASLTVREWPARRAMLAGCAALVVGAAVTVAGVASGSALLYFLGSAVAGTGFGAAFLGAFRTLAALAGPAGRGALVAAVYLVAYLAFSVPAVVAGVVATGAGLHATAVGYGVAVGLLAALAAAATVLRERRLTR